MKYRKVLFVCGDNTVLSPMAMAIMCKIMPDVEVGSKGMVVLFSEPFNPKIFSILEKDNIEIVHGCSSQISNDDFRTDTLVLTMEEKQRHDVYAQYSRAINVHSIGGYINEPVQIEEPFGKGMEQYYAVYEELTRLLIKVKNKLEKETQE